MICLCFLVYTQLRAFGRNSRNNLVVFLQEIQKKKICFWNFLTFKSSKYSKLNIWFHSRYFLQLFYTIFKIAGTLEAVVDLRPITSEPSAKNLLPNVEVKKRGENSIIQNFLWNRSFHGNFQNEHCILTIFCFSGRLGESSTEKHDMWGAGLKIHTKPWVRAR